MTSIYAKKESDKFLSLNPTPELKSFVEDDHKYINIKCLYSKDYNIYSLQELQNDEKDYSIEQNGELIQFNFCRNTKGVNDATFFKCENNSIGNITRLSGSIDGEGSNKENKNTWNENNDKTGIVITFNQGDKCNDTMNYQVILEIECDAEIDKDMFKKSPSKYLTFSNDTDECTYKMKMKSLYGCSLKSSYLMKKLFGDYKVVFTIIFILFGLLFCIKGFSMLSKTLVILCGIIGCYALTAFVLNVFPTFITSETLLFVCLGVTFILGCIIGFLIEGHVKAPIILFGGFLGYSCAIFVYQIVLNYVEYDPQIVYYVCIAVCIILGVLISWKLSDYIIILGTSVFGGYLVMRGISFVAGHYLDEGLVIDLIKNNEFEELKNMRDNWIYAYLGTWIVLSIAGVYYQCKNKDKSQSKDYKKM